MSEWGKPEDVVTTTFATIIKVHQNSSNEAWEGAINMVLDVIGSMYNEYDHKTLEELRQRIV